MTKMSQQKMIKISQRKKHSAAFFSVIDRNVFEMTKKI